MDLPKDQMDGTITETASMPTDSTKTDLVDTTEEDVSGKSATAAIASSNPTIALASGDLHQQQPTASYSVWSKRKKQVVVLSASFGAVFSTLTATAYLPALSVIATDLNVSITKINLTVTTYLIFQGVTPMLLGAFADRMGRRPAYIICFIVYGAANIGLALSPSYGALLGLRCLQAAGISGTQTLCQAVVADIITSAERGQYIGFVTLSAILGPLLGPLLGGGLTDGLGWRSIFWFLVICAGVILILVVLFFPETCRPIVGDGSIVPPRSNQTVVQLIKDTRAAKRGEVTSVVASQGCEGGKNTERGFALKHFLTSLRLLGDLELVLLLFYGGVVYSSVLAISAALPSQFAEIYHLNSLEIGLVYLPMAAGSIIAVTVTGKMLDWNFRRHAAKLGVTVDEKTQMDMTNFPIERARLELGIPMLLATTGLIIAWGWTLERRASIAVPFVISFLLGVFYIGITNILNVVITDLYRKQAAAAVAASWFVRCALAALMSAVIQLIIEAVGSGWAFTILGLFYVVFSPALILVMWKGQQWRREKREKTERREAEKAA